MIKIEKIPIEFTRKYLRAKGYKETFHYWCECDIKLYYKEDIGGHPVRWLWQHIRKEHEPSFDCCHSWDRQVGRDTGVIEEWYRWYSFTWSKQYNEWLISDTYQGCEGFEETSPANCWRRYIRMNRNAPVITLPRYSASAKVKYVIEAVE